MDAKEVSLKISELSLETLCLSCNGRGGETERGRWCPCYDCEGAGYLPTEYGEKVLALMRHNFKTILRKAADD